MLTSYFWPSRFLTVSQFVRVWRNECLRIFHDRLIDETDKALVTLYDTYCHLYVFQDIYSMVTSSLLKSDLLLCRFLLLLFYIQYFSFSFFPIQVQDLIKNLVGEYFKSDTEAVMKDPILFGDYSNALDESEPRVYKDIIDYDASKALFQVL